MKFFKYGQKGFTLIELLVVIAILGTLAGVVVLNVIQFIGKGACEAALTELHNVQTAAVAYSYSSGVASFTETVTYGTKGTNIAAYLLTPVKYNYQITNGVATMTAGSGSNAKPTCVPAIP
jgi:prepilin-type N-terminal cleavage/methylation domain-containing protein